MPLAGPRRAYAEMTLTTASPARLVTMLYDRLSRDLTEAVDALDSQSLSKAHDTLVHAQEIVAALKAALDPTVWDGARQLADIYTFLLERLVAANVRKDATMVRECLGIVEPLRDAWHTAYLTAGDAQRVPGGM